MSFLQKRNLFICVSLAHHCLLSTALAVSNTFHILCFSSEIKEEKTLVTTMNHCLVYQRAMGIMGPYSRGIIALACSKTNTGSTRPRTGAKFGPRPPVAILLLLVSILPHAVSFIAPLTETKGNYESLKGIIQEPLIGRSSTLIPFQLKMDLKYT